MWLTTDKWAEEYKLPKPIQTLDFDKRVNEVQCERRAFPGYGTVSILKNKKQQETENKYKETSPFHTLCHASPK